MWVLHATVSLVIGGIVSSGCKDTTLQAVLQDNAALRKENTDLRQENAALRKELADLRTAWGNGRGNFRRQLQDGCPCAGRTTEAVVNPYWKVTSGDCVADLDCLISPRYPQNYPDDVTCSIEILGNWSGYLDVQDFELEVCRLISCG